MRSSSRFAMFSIVFAAAACSSPTPPPPTAPAPVAATMPAPATGSGTTATRCTAPHSFNDSGFHVRMTVSNEGGTCSFEAYATGYGKSGTGGKFPYKTGTVGTDPAHGTVAFRFLPDSSFVDYTPTAGYVGPDHFTLHLLPGSRLWDVNVNVVK